MKSRWIAASGSSSCQLFYHCYQLLLLPSASTWPMPREAKKNCCALDVPLPIMVRWSQKDCSAALGFWNCQNEVCEPTAMNKEQFTGERKDWRNEWPANEITEIILWHLQQGMTKMLKLGPIFTVQLNKNYWTRRRKPNTTSFKTVLLFFPLFNYFKYNISFLFIIFILTFWITPIEDASSHLSVVQG